MYALSTEIAKAKGEVGVSKYTGYSRGESRKSSFATFVVQQGHRTIFDIVQRPNLLPEAQGGSSLQA